MRILDLLFGWRPKKNMLYRNATWDSRRGPVKGEAQGHVKIRDSSSKKSEVYVVINGTRYIGTFKIVKNSCTLGIGRWLTITKLYKTPTKNIKFTKKYLGHKVSSIYGTAHTYNYEFTAEVLDASKLVTEVIPSVASKRYSVTAHNKIAGTQIVRRRGTAIVDTPKGILVVSGRHKLFILPGGGARHGESREKATMRELEEETGLKTTSSKYLFTHHDSRDRKIRNLHKVFLIKVNGQAKPDGHEVKHIAYWKPDSDITISPTTRILVEKYLNEFKK